MKIVIDRKSLNLAMAQAVKIARTNNIGILSCVRIDAAPGAIELTVSDITVSLRQTLTANVSEPGTAIVEAETFRSIVKALSNHTFLTIETRIADSGSASF